MSDELRILLAEDDLNLGMVIQDALSLEGYLVHLATSGSDALKRFQENTYDLCILDVMMPKKDGFTVARSIRKTDEDVPIFFLTAKSETSDKIEGFRAGGDDYLTKPFDTEEFLLRVGALLRRNPERKEKATHFELGSFTYNTENKQLTGANGEVRTLTKKEAGIMDLLCQNQNKVVERQLLLNRVWGDDSYFSGRSLDVFITRLRKYLKPDPAVAITNIHGVGFQLEIKNPA